MIWYKSHTLTGKPIFLFIIYQDWIRFSHILFLTWKQGHFNNYDCDILTRILPTQFLSLKTWTFVKSTWFRLQREIKSWPDQILTYLFSPLFVFTHMHMKRTVKSWSSNVGSVAVTVPLSDKKRKVTKMKETYNEKKINKSRKRYANRILRQKENETKRTFAEISRK